MQYMIAIMITTNDSNLNSSSSDDFKIKNMDKNKYNNNNIII